jgi:hypothetical protein
MSLSIHRGVKPALRRTAALPVVLTVAAIAAGCASPEDVEFVDDYNAAVAPLTTTVSRLSTSIPSEPKAASKELDQVADRLVDVRADLAALDPPDDAADEFDRLLVTLGKSTKHVRAMARATKTGDLKRLGRATSNLSASASKLIAIEEELRAVVEN